jgi:hypothetical protein
MLVFPILGLLLTLVTKYFSSDEDSQKNTLR